MKTPLIFKVLVPILFLGVCASVAAIWDGRSIKCFPSPDKQSKFFQSYAAQQVVDSFASRQYGGQREDGTSAGAGQNSVTNDRAIVPMFTIQHEKTVALMLALRDDMSAQLTRSKAAILSESGDPQSGFRFTYRLGRDAGFATIAPIATRNWANRSASLPQGMQDVAIDIKISEKWFPTAPNAIKASLNYR